MFVTLSKASEYYGVTKVTIRRWSQAGKIQVLSTPGAQHRYWIPLDNIQCEFDGKRYQAIYARVSTSRQRTDLERQVNILKEKHARAVVFTDIGSSLNYQRHSFQKLLSEVLQGRISQIFCSHKDRIARFGFDLIVSICKRFGTDVIVDSLVDIPNSIEQELIEDLLACTHSFSGKLYHSRRCPVKATGHSDTAMSEPF